MRGKAPWSFVAASVVVGGVAGCQMGSAPLVDPAVAGMGCEQAETFAFSGETSLAAIGLGDDFGMGPDGSRTGMIWVTAEPVDLNGGFGPAGPGMQPQFERMVCVQWPDGSGMSGPVPADWEPPNVFDAAAAPDEGPPLTLIGLVVAALVIVGVSFLAFRERAPA